MSDFKQILEKCKRKCASRETCGQEILDELTKKEGLEMAEKVLALLVEEKYVDNARYARSFASEKHRINKWGIIKIRYFLQQRKIDSVWINEALDAVNSMEYEQAAELEIKKKLRMLKSEKPGWKWKKVIQYMYSKGYEQELTARILSGIFKEKPVEDDFLISEE